MKYILVTALMFFGLHTLQAQDISAFKKANAQYEFRSFVMDDMWHWRENRYPVAQLSHPDKWGYIDTLGTIVVPLQYEYAGKFSNDLALVKHNGKYGFINKDGKVKIPFKYEDAAPFINGIAKVAHYEGQGAEKKLHWISIDSNGNIVSN
jgi:hypothetical protein